MKAVNASSQTCSMQPGFCIGLIHHCMEGRPHVKKEDSFSKPYATACCKFDGTVKTKNWCALAIALIRDDGPVTHPIYTQSTLSVRCMLCIRHILHYRKLHCRWATSHASDVCQACFKTLCELSQSTRVELILSGHTRVEYSVLCSRL